MFAPTGAANVHIPPSVRPVFAGWKKSSRCVDGDCVEVRVSLGRIFVRSSKDPAGSHLSMTATQFADFLAFVNSPEARPSRPA
ncbi:DUF397 domain-containing protein [Cryptosporangium phraense]|uniref:DUF397 domain-containing protein n=1 Tax=Cryptosporangium phraense TaxID=2593070 RepID=A0A545AV06_9ACTN|nr:DUF397 domain-containing protein [Cryptosporangium phraense]